MLTNICHQRLSQTKNRTKKLISIFLNFSEEMTNLFVEFGMVLPVLTRLKTLCAPVYNLLIPEETYVSEKIRYAGTCWAKRDCDKEPFGWSNVPLMLWLIGYLVQERFIAIRKKLPTAKSSGDVSPASNIPADKKSPQSVSDNLPGIEFTVNEQQVSLTGVVKFILFHLSEDSLLSDRIMDRSKFVTKTEFYSDLKSLFRIDGLKIRLTKTNPDQPMGTSSGTVPIERKSTVGTKATKSFGSSTKRQLSMREKEKKQQQEDQKNIQQRSQRKRRIESAGVVASDANRKRKMNRTTTGRNNTSKRQKARSSAGNGGQKKGSSDDCQTPKQRKPCSEAESHAFEQFNQDEEGDGYEDKDLYLRVMDSIDDLNYAELYSPDLPATVNTQPLADTSNKAFLSNLDSEPQETDPSSSKVNDQESDVKQSTTNDDKTTKKETSNQISKGITEKELFPTSSEDEDEESEDKDEESDAESGDSKQVEQPKMFVSSSGEDEESDAKSSTSNDKAQPKEQENLRAARREDLGSTTDKEAAKATGSVSESELNQASTLVTGVSGPETQGESLLQVFLLVIDRTQRPLVDICFKRASKTTLQLVPADGYNSAKKKLGRPTKAS